MPRDGTGTYIKPEPSVITNTPITSSGYNSTTDDMANALTGSLARDGQGGMLANLDMNNFRVESLGAPVAATDAARRQEVGVEFIAGSSPSGTPTFMEFALPAGFASFFCDFANIAASANARLAFQLSVNGGASWLTGASEYVVGFSGTAGTAAAAGSSAANITGICSAGFGVRGKMEISPALPGLAATNFVNLSTYTDSFTGNYETMMFGGTSVQTATRPDRIRFFFNGSTFLNRGRISLMGVRL